MTLTNWIIILAAAVVILLIVVIWLWVRYRTSVENVNFLFAALDNGDYNFRFSERRKWKNDRQLNSSLNRVKEILQHARDEQLEREKHFELILNAVDTGILVIDEEHDYVLRTNQAALRLLGRDSVTYFSQVKDDLKNFSVRETHNVLGGRKVRIIGFSDIKGELANQETDSWVRLIRVLTHEIMNTLTPVISLSETLLPKSEGEQREGLQVINRTSKDLIRFVENYRKFTHIPQPCPSPFYVKPFVERMARLAKPLLPAQSDVQIDVKPADLMVYADEGLIARVVSNLLKNAAEAIHEGQHVWVKAYTDSMEAVIIDVIDDGELIPEDVAAHIFIPFFTTKAEGSGIGLSISRQTMRVSNGTIALLSDRKKGLTTFRLTFP